MCFSAHSPNTIARKTLLLPLHLISSHRPQPYCILSNPLPYLLPHIPIASIDSYLTNTPKLPPATVHFGDNTHVPANKMMVARGDKHQR